MTLRDVVGEAFWAVVFRVACVIAAVVAQRRDARSGGGACRGDNDG